MEIFDQQTNMLQANISSKYPVFTVGGLDAGKLLKIIIYAINVKGRSESVLLEAFTLKTAEKQTGKISFFILALSLSLYPPPHGHKPSFLLSENEINISFCYLFSYLFVCIIQIQVSLKHLTNQQCSHLEFWWVYWLL